MKLRDETFLIDTPDEMFDLGYKFAAAAEFPRVILLSGDLGAGKTLFTKGFAAGCGFDADEVNSPSFTLVNVYRTSTVSIFHIDLWRMTEGPQAAFAVGLDEILEQDGRVVIIEWPERLGRYEFSEDVAHISMIGDGDLPRTVTVRFEKG